MDQRGSGRIEGRTAVVTGGASGIGLALARAFARRGCKVMILDVEAAALEAALSALRAGSNADVRGLVCDVALREAVEQAAAETAEALGPIHILCANAGVGGMAGPIDQCSERDWRWVLGVNLMGMVHAVDAFLPRIRAHGEGGRVVYTASMAGMISPPNMGAYAASKFATVAMAECLEAELQGSGIGVSVLCPAFVSTRIHESDRNRPADLAGGRLLSEAVRTAMRDLVEAGIPADSVAERVMEALEEGEFYIFTHPDTRAAVEQRFQRIRAAFDAAERSPALAGLGASILPPLSSVAFAPEAEGLAG